MTKEDKQFITDLITGVKTDLESQIRQNGVLIEGVKTDLEGQIRRNGVLIEDTQSDIKTLREGHETIYGCLKRVERDVEEIKENTHDLPIIRQTVASHSAAILELSK
ncbi:hypothetical protein KJ742_00970 [Patescibacteria group bacterium]|nr:hypothetical protein [Patescibacteria group bacterium]MBU1682495.1 hypothetical protein [Patescibacteria group bacterium]MBU1935281.1 hypothetical protein [Patescibacteria group bacterium]